MSSESATSHLNSYFADYENDNNESELRSSLMTTSLPELPSVSLTPIVDSASILQILANKDKQFIRSHDELLKTNLPADQMHAPLQGPLLPQQKWGGLEQAYYKNTVTGNVEHCHVNSTAFDIQRQQFQRHGVAEDPSDFKRPSTSASRSRIAPFQGDTRSLIPPGDSAVAVAAEQTIANEPYYQEKDQASRKRQKRMDRGDPATESCK